MNKIIEEFPDYIIYDDGRVFSMKSNKFIYVGPDGNRGYLQVSFYQDGEKIYSKNTQTCC